MKTVNEITRKVGGSGVCAAAILIATLAAVAPANAQYRATGDDGITASPKARAQLDERRARSASAVTAETAMSCTKCQDIWVAQADTNSKGSGSRALLGQATRLVVKHKCDGCGTEWSVAGTGKTKQAVATHKCTGCGAENLACCSGKGSAQKVEVAPLK